MSEQPSQPGRPDLAPGDVASPDAPNAGEDICPRCGGSGRHDGQECPVCAGTGKVVEAIGGG